MSSARTECGFCFTIPVTGFCENCQYRLCETCSKNHPRVDMFKNHNVVRTEGFTNPKEELDVDINEQKCKIHTDEKTALYCEEHDVCLCVCCLLLEHKGCICSTIHLGNVVCDTKIINEYISELDEMEDQTDCIASEIEENIKLIAELRSKCEKDIDTFYDELIIKLIKLRNNAQTEIANKYRQNTEHLEYVLVSCNENRERIRQHIKHIGNLVQKKQDRNLYVTFKREGNTTDEFLCSNQQCRINNQVTKLTFARNSELEKILKNDTLNFGITIDVCDGSEEVIEQITEELDKLPKICDIRTNLDELWEALPTSGVSAGEETDIARDESMKQFQTEYPDLQITSAKPKKQQKKQKNWQQHTPIDMEIFVRTSTDKTITLSVNYSTSIEAVKAQIEQKLGLPTNEQRLHFAGKFLRNNWCLSDYNIQNNSTLYIA